MILLSIFFNAGERPAAIGTTSGVTSEQAKASGWAGDDDAAMGIFRAACEHKQAHHGSGKDLFIS